MWLVGHTLALLSLLPVSFEAPHVPPGFVTCIHKFRGGHEWVGQVNSNLCYKHITVDRFVRKKVAQDMCKQHDKPANPDKEPVGHLPFLKTKADRDAFITLTSNTTCKVPTRLLSLALCFYWIGIEMVSYEPKHPNPRYIYWEDEEQFGRGVAKYQWDDGLMENDWERDDFISWRRGFFVHFVTIPEHKYVVAGGNKNHGFENSNENVSPKPQRFYMTVPVLHGYHLAFCQKIITSRLTAPPIVSTTSLGPLPSKRMQPSTTRIYERISLVNPTHTTVHKPTDIEVIVPSSLDEGGLSTTLIYILAGSFGLVLVVAMLIAGVYGMHIKGKRRRHNRKSDKVKTNMEKPSSSTAQIDIDSSATEHT